jgi:hypothetical protein
MLGFKASTKEALKIGYDFSLKFPEHKVPVLKNGFIDQQGCLVKLGANKWSFVKK